MLKFVFILFDDFDGNFRKYVTVASSLKQAAIDVFQREEGIDPSVLKDMNSYEQLRNFFTNFDDSLTVVGFSPSNGVIIHKDEELVEFWE